MTERKTRTSSRPPKAEATESTTRRSSRPPRAAMGQDVMAQDVMKGNDDDRRRMIAEAAYYIAEKREFHPGNELEDWLAAEREVSRKLSGHPR